MHLTVWQAVRPVLQPRIEAARNMRLGLKHRGTTSERRSLIDAAYNKFKRQLEPIEWIYLPPIHAVYAMAPFRRLVYSDFDIPLTQATCDKVARRLPSYLSPFRNHLQDHLISCTVQGNDCGDGIRSTDKAKKYLVKDRDGLGYRPLAVNVFALIIEGDVRPIYLFGIDDVLAHLSYPHSQLHSTSNFYLDSDDVAFWISLCDMPAREGQISDFTMVYNTRASDLVRDLIIELGLDPRTARAEELDRLDLRLTCKKCKGPDHAYTWRYMVSCASYSTCTQLILPDTR